MDKTLSLDLQQTDFGRGLDKEIKRLDGRIDTETETRAAADQEIWNEIEAIEAASDVVDVVGTHEELENYDTSALKDNDIIKVLADETHDDAIAYYRWNDSGDEFTFIGVEGPYYTASETDTLLAGKVDKTSVISSPSFIPMSASETLVMSQKGVARQVLNADNGGIQISSTGGNASAGSAVSVAIGPSAEAGQSPATAVGYSAKALGSCSTALGYNAKAAGTYDIALGYCSTEVASGSTQTNNNVAVGTLGVSANGGLASAFGCNGVTASGQYATAIGNGGTTASGLDSTAVGYGVRATGERAAAFGTSGNGGGATASGKNSTAIGFGAITASGEGSMAMGANSVTAAGANDIAIGGSGTTTKVSSGTQTTGNVSVGLSVTANGGDSAAFGSNGLYATGKTSTAIGHNGVTASGELSTAIGAVAAVASGKGSTALGYSGVTASGEKSTAVGASTVTASGKNSAAFGADIVTAAGDYDIAIGTNGVGVYDSFNMAIGIAGAYAGNSSSTASSSYNFAFGGQSVQAYGGYSIAIGTTGTRASAERTVAIGHRYCTASHADSVALGTDAATGRTFEVSLGKDAVGSNPEVTKYIAHVTAGVNDTDAVNVKQMNDAIAAAGGGGGGSQNVWYATAYGGESPLLTATTVSGSAPFVLAAGAIVFVKFTNGSQGEFTMRQLKVDSTSGAYISSNSGFTANETVCFVYDGTNWRVVGKTRATTENYGEVRLASSYADNTSTTVPTSAHLHSVYAIANGKQDALTVGTGITIDSNNTISAVTNNINSTDWNALWQ